MWNYYIPTHISTPGYAQLWSPMISYASWSADNGWLSTFWNDLKKEIEKESSIFIGWRGAEL